MEPNDHLWLICIPLFAAEILLVGVAYGQASEINSTIEKTNITKFTEISPLNRIVEDTDILLKPDLSASLAGLALAAATFLFGYKTETLAENIREFGRETQNRDHINQAKKDFIYSFFLLIVCTLVIFGFDIFEAGITQEDLKTIGVDDLSKYTLFAAGLFFLGKGANHLYRGLIGVKPVVQPTYGDLVNRVKKFIASNPNATIMEIASALGETKEEVEFIVIWLHIDKHPDTTITDIASALQENKKEVELIVKELKASYQLKERNLIYKKTYRAVPRRSLRN